MSTISVDPFLLPELVKLVKGWIVSGLEMAILELIDPIFPGY
jgi:hypothetical protein